MQATDPKLPWPHAPSHQLGEGGVFFVTASTLGKEHHFRSRERISVLHRGLLKVASTYDRRLEAWAVFSNHYHFIGRTGESAADAGSLADMLSVLHVKTSRWINRLDGCRGRQVWFNYWETCLTNQRSYMTRLNYVHQNAVRHRLVPMANQYPWCSAGWLERTAAPAIVKSIYRFKFDRISVDDDYEPSIDW